MKDISIIIVNWNVRELLYASLDSIYKTRNNLDLEVIVIDNNSSDDSVEMVKAEFPEVQLIANSENRGFAAANNQGIEIATGKYLFILNPDTELKPNTLKLMYRYMEEHGNIAAIGPRLLNTDGSLQPSCRRFPALKYEIFSKLFLDKIFPRSIFNGYMMGDFSHDYTREIDQPMGAAIFIRKEVVDTVGMMDEHNFVWFDEVDWCYQIKKAGHKIFFYSEAELYHHQGKSFKRWKNPMSGVIWLKSRHYFLKKNLGSTIATLFMVADIGFNLIYILILLLILIKVF